MVKYPRVGYGQGIFSEERKVVVRGNWQQAGGLAKCVSDTPFTVFGLQYHVPSSSSFRCFSSPFPWL